MVIPGLPGRKREERRSMAFEEPRNPQKGALKHRVIVIRLWKLSSCAQMKEKEEDGSNLEFEVRVDIKGGTLGR